MLQYWKILKGGVGESVWLLWKLNPGVRTITLTTIANYTCKLLTKETEYGAEH